MSKSSDTLREIVRKSAVDMCMGCAIQGPGDDDGRGWPCGSCFQSTLVEVGVPEHLAHAAWLACLAARGEGYYHPELDPYREDNQVASARQLRVNKDGFDPDRMEHGEVGRKVE